jgi:hypothetical protein
MDDKKTGEKFQGRMKGQLLGFCILNLPERPLEAEI